MSFSVEVEVLGFSAEVKMVKRVGFSVEVLLLLFSMALALVLAQFEILGFSAEGQMVEQSGGL